jgi:glutamyl-tRNA synthetase
VAQCKFYFEDQVTFDEAAKTKWLTADGKKLLETIYARLNALEPFNEQSIGAIFKQLVEETGLKMVNLAQPCRVALCGSTVSPGIYEVMTVLGKPKTLQRIQTALSQ